MRRITSHVMATCDDDQVRPGFLRCARVIIINLMINSNTTAPLFPTLPEVQCRPIRSLS